MKASFFSILLVWIAYTACSPPEAVRLQNFQEPPAEGLYANIPVCFGNAAIALGMTQAEFESISLKMSELNETACESGILEKEYLLARRDTTLMCTFESGRLVRFKSQTAIASYCTSANEAFHQLAQIYPCLGELGAWMDAHAVSSYRYGDEAFTGEFRIQKEGKQITGLSYQISYPGRSNC
jgi:hypothetical protein